MTKKLTDEQKYAYIKQKYGKNADKILKKFGAYAYDIDKAFPAQAAKLGGEKNKDYLLNRWENQLSKGQYSEFYVVSLLEGNGINLGKSNNDKRDAIRSSANAYKKYAEKKARAEEDAKKIAYIKQKYGEKADVMLATYGTKAYEIDKNFNKYYSGKVLFGRNFWMDTRESQERSIEGAKNKKLFEEGKLPLDEAAKIINCPAYFGTMASTVTRISEEIRQSSAQYIAANRTKTDEKTLAQKQKAPEKPAPVKTQTQTQTQTQTVEKPAEKKPVKQELKNQRTVADKSEMLMADLPEVVVTGSAKKFNERLDQMKIQAEAVTVEAPKIELNIKSPAEYKYDELIAQKTAKMPDEVMGRKDTEIGLTLRELVDLGVDPTKDIQYILRSVDKETAEKLIPAGGFGNENAIVSKELALAAIARVQLRQAQTHRRGRQRG